MTDPRISPSDPPYQFLQNFGGYFNAVAQGLYLPQITRTEPLLQHLKVKLAGFSQLFASQPQHPLANPTFTAPDYYNRMLRPDGEVSTQPSLTQQFPPAKPFVLNQFNEHQILQNLAEETAALLQNHAASGAPNRHTLLLLALSIQVLHVRAESRGIEALSRIAEELRLSLRAHTESLPSDFAELRDPLDWARDIAFDLNAAALLQRLIRTHCFHFDAALLQLLPETSSYHDHLPEFTPTPAQPLDSAYLEDALKRIQTLETFYTSVGDYLSRLCSPEALDADGRLSPLFLLVMQLFDNQGLLTALQSGEWKALSPIAGRLPEGVREFIDDLQRVCLNLLNLARLQAMIHEVHAVHDGVLMIELDLPPRRTEPYDLAHLEACRQRLTAAEALVQEELQRLADQSALLRIDEGGLLNRNLSELVSRLGASCGITTDALRYVLEFTRKSGPAYEAVLKHFDKLRRQLKYCQETRDFQSALLDECRRFIKQENFKKAQRTFQSIEPLFTDLDYAGVRSELDQLEAKVNQWRGFFQDFADFAHRAKSQLAINSFKSNGTLKQDVLKELDQWKAFFDEARPKIAAETQGECSRELTAEFTQAETLYRSLREKLTSP